MMIRPFQTASPLQTALSDGAYFDRLVHETGDFNPFKDRGWQTLQRCFAQVTADTRELRVLDVGCGTGQSRRIYAPQARTYTGVDLSRVALRVARARHGGSAWLQGDAHRLPFADGSFDVIAFSSVLHHLADIEIALAAARRVVTPGGLIFAFDPNLLHPAMLLFRHPRSPFYRPEGVSPSERPMLPHRLRRAFDAAALTNVGQRCQSDIPYREVAPRWLNRLLTFYNSADWVGQKVGAARWFGTFVVTWGRKP